MNESEIASTTAKNLANTPDVTIHPQILTINGHKAVAWDQYTGRSEVIQAGKVIRDNPMPMPAGVILYDASGHKMYSMSAMKPLSELLTIMNSIPPS
jgi:hypothetical protein